MWGRLKTVNKKTFANFDLIETSYSFGRRSDNAVQIEDNRASSYHCTIEKRKDSEDKYKVYLKDTSTNGTFVNGTKVSIINPRSGRIKRKSYLRAIKSRS